MKPKQAADNPHDIIANRREWVRFEYEATRGDLMGLRDYAKRYALMIDIQCEHGDLSAMQKAMAYLLGMEKELETR
jgi:hypothetical protein